MGHSRSHTGDSREEVKLCPWAARLAGDTEWVFRYASQLESRHAPDPPETVFNSFPRAATFTRQPVAHAANYNIYLEFCAALRRLSGHGARVPDRRPTSLAPALEPVWPSAPTRMRLLPGGLPQEPEVP